MSIEEHRCPKCSRTLQLVATPVGSILACPCGYGTDTVVEEELTQVVAFEDTLGIRTRMTSITEPKRS